MFSVMSFSEKEHLKITHFHFLFTNKVEQPGANIASEQVTSTLVAGTTASTFSSFEKVSRLTVKECILNSDPKSVNLTPSLPNS